jgi:hypothetical protein
MRAMHNWMELNLSPEDDKFVRRYGELYRAQYVETIDTVFGIAKSIDILKEQFDRSGIRGAFGDALVQYGYIARDGGPMNKAIRSFHKQLLDNEAAVRAWWAKVPDPKKRDWLSAKAICTNWKASLRPPTPRKPSPNIELQGQPVTKPAGGDAAAAARIRELEAELARERKRREPTKPSAKDQEIAALPPLSKTERAELAAYKRQIKSEVRRELEAQFEQRVRAEAKEMVDYNVMLWFERFKVAEAKIKDFGEKIGRWKPILSKRTLRLMIGGAHPDRGGTAAAATEVNDNREAIEAALCGSEAERRKWELTPPPMSRAELDAAREKVRAENSARAKRAAATRAARKTD